MTDARFGDDLLPAVRRLPFGSGVIFRHYHLAPAERRRLFRQVRTICRQRGHMLMLSGPESDALAWQADGFHCRSGRSRSNFPRSAAVHNYAELREALRNSADLLLISPLFATASHKGEKPLGRPAFNIMVKQCGAAAVIALGGMTARKAATLDKRIVHGWAAIDAFRR